MHRGVGHAGHGGPDQRPGHVLAVGGQVATGMVAFVVGGGGPPAGHGVVVVRAGVDPVCLLYTSNIPISDTDLPKIPFYKPADDTPEMKYLHERRKALGGYLPKRRVKADESFTVPSLETFKSVLEPTAEGREISTTQAYVRFLTQLLRDKALGPRVVPILVDEARTFGMEGLFRQIGIYNPEGQKYTPVDKDQVMYLSLIHI